MISDLPNRKSAEESQDALQRAMAYGVDISLLIENLRLTPTERIEKLARVATFLEQVRRSGELQRKNLVS